MRFPIEAIHLIKQVLKKRLFTVFFVTMAVMVVLFLPVGLGSLLRVGCLGMDDRRRRGWWCCKGADGPLDDFIEFTAVQPDAPALRAVIDLDPLPFRHDQINIADRTFHLIFLL
jgi:hypothetical protein